LICRIYSYKYNIATYHCGFFRVQQEEEGTCTAAHAHGEMALGIIVTDHNGGRISFWRATGRHFARITSAFILLIGYIMIAFTERKQVKGTCQSKDVYRGKNKAETGRIEEH